MAQAEYTYEAGEDAIDRVAEIKPGDALAELRAKRPDVARYAQGSYEALLQPPDPGPFSLAERYLAALRVAALSGSHAAAHYRGRLGQLGADASLVAAAEHGSGAAHMPLRVAAILQHAERMTLSPHTTGMAALTDLQAAGLSAREIVSLAQLITFVTFQVRVIAGLRLLAGQQPDTGHPPAELLRHSGFTLDAVGWHSFLPVADPATATLDELAVLDESSPQGRTSQYYLLLIHDADALRERSQLFKAVMYGRGGLARADRELATVAVSLVNGCVYCASVHSQRYAQLTKRPETMQRLFDQDVAAELVPRERAIVDFAVALSRDATGATADLVPLRAAGLSDDEILDLIHAVAMFAWANRLLQTLGEVVRQPAQAA
jgi:CMD domain protein